MFVTQICPFTTKLVAIGTRNKLDSKVHGVNMGAHLGPFGPRWAPCWPHEPYYLGNLLFAISEHHGGYWWSHSWLCGHKDDWCWLRTHICSSNAHYKDVMARAHYANYCPFVSILQQSPVDVHHKRSVMLRFDISRTNEQIIKLSVIWGATTLKRWHRDLVVCA